MLTTVLSLTFTIRCIQPQHYGTVDKPFLFVRKMFTNTAYLKPVMSHTTADCRNIKDRLGYRQDITVDVSDKTD